MPAGDGSVQRVSSPIYFEDGFKRRTLKIEERKRLGIEGYYRPYRVDASEIVRGNKAYEAVKRLFDIVFASAALLLTFPILLVFMLAVYLEDPKASPVFKQVRIGKDGKPFVMYKLRSMYADAEENFDSILHQNEAQDKAFKIKNDPRITTVGRIARKFSIDELMQLINVIKSDMSIVGPRPPLPREVAQYDEYDFQRLSVKPGLTCYWQVFDGRHEISFEDWVALDIKYLLNRSFRTDLMLILQTVLVVFAGKGD